MLGVRVSICVGVCARREGEREKSLSFSLSVCVCVHVSARACVCRVIDERLAVLTVPTQPRQHDIGSDVCRIRSEPSPRRY